MSNQRRVIIKPDVMRSIDAIGPLVNQCVGTVIGHGNDGVIVLWDSGVRGEVPGNRLQNV